MNRRAVTATIEPASRHERRKAQTRRQLLDAARALFVAHGYDATRPQDIARAADVAAGTFYLHFADKRAAFLAFTDEAAEQLMECVRARTVDARDFEDGLLRSLEAISSTRAHPGVLAAVRRRERARRRGAAGREPARPAGPVSRRRCARARCAVSCAASSTPR
jgi:AcrR family transcriptional regulator